MLENILRALLPLDSDKLLSSAIRKAGRKPSCFQECEENLRALSDACDKEAGLSLIGRIAARQHLLELLETRFRLMDYWQRTPEIQEQAVLPQVFITGLPKSGSTFLHRLLAHDVTNRAPRMWEVMFPLPYPVSEEYSNGRIRKADRRLRFLHWAHPDLVKAHPIGALIPQECGSILGYSFESNVFLDMFSIPTYETRLRSHTMESAYEFHASFLKHLQCQNSAERWVLKSSDHVHTLPTLLKTYPEARIVFLHRYPLKVLQAASSQMTLLKSVFSRRINRRHLGAYETRTLNDKVKKIMEFRANHVDVEDHFMDVRYLDLAADPIGTVEVIYDRFGFHLSSADRSRMEAFVTAERDKIREDCFSLSDFTLGPEQDSSHFNLYCERFNVKREEL